MDETTSWQPAPPRGAGGRSAALLVLLVGLLAGCASTPRGETIAMDPLHFRVVDGPDGQRVEAADPEVLFLEGNQAFEALEFERAAKLYLAIIAEFPGSAWERVATFNGGLALEKAGRCGEALPHFRAVVALSPAEKDGQDALFRVAACARVLEKWEMVKSATEEILKPFITNMNVVDRIAALALHGRALEGLGELALAERDYRAALELYRSNLGLSGIERSSEVSLAQFRIGEIYRRLFASIQFKLPLERMSRDLEDKSNFFLMAQTAYLRALRLRHSDWATIAGFELGALYEQMYRDMLGAEVPADLTTEELEIYEEELKSKVRPLLVRAIDIFERNLRLGQHFGRRDSWMTRTEASLARLTELLKQESKKAAAP